MKKNKILSLIAALALTAGTSTTAVLAEGEDQSVTGGIGKTYNLNGDSNTAKSPAEELVLTVGDGEIVKAETGVTTVPAESKPTIEKLSVKDGDAGTNISDKFTVALPTYTSTGIFKYTVSETDGKLAGVDYDSEDYTLVVYATRDDATSKITSTANLYKNYNNETNSGTKVQAIVNSYTAGKLQVTKSVTGSYGDKSKDFAVTVTFTAPENTTFGNNAVVLNGTATTYSEDKKTATVTLTVKEGSDYTIVNIPKGTTYSVAETIDSDYTPAYLVTDKTSENDTIATEVSGYSGKINATETDVVAITNAETGTTTPTGINLDNAPYIALIGIVAVAAVVFVTRKHAED